MKAKRAEVKARVEEAARIAGLKYIVNVVYDVTHKIVGCFTGDFVAAHREGTLCSREVYAARFGPEPAWDPCWMKGDR